MGRVRTFGCVVVVVASVIVVALVVGGELEALSSGLFPGLELAGSCWPPTGAPLVQYMPQSSSSVATRTVLGTMVCPLALRDGAMSN